MIRITGSEFITSACEPDQYPATSFAEFAFVGKSNVGKSSLLNTVLNRKSLAKVSGQPGKTRLVNFFRVRFKDGDNEGFFTLVDLPGYGYARVSKTERDKWKIMISKYFEYRLQLMKVFVLVDIRHKTDPKDIELVSMLNDISKPYCVVATKSDKISISIQPARLKGLQEGLGLSAKPLVFSALKKKGVSQILDEIGKSVI